MTSITNYTNIVWPFFDEFVNLDILSIEVLSRFWLIYRLRFCFFSSLCRAGEMPGGARLLFSLIKKNVGHHGWPTKKIVGPTLP